MSPALRPIAAAALLFLGGCVDSVPQYSLTGGEQGIFRSANAGRPIPVSQIKGMTEAQLSATFGAAKLDRKDGPSRVLRYDSDACSLFVYLTNDRTSYAEAYDPQLRPLINTDQCAGSVAAQRRSA